MWFPRDPDFAESTITGTLGGAVGVVAFLVVFGLALGVIQGVLTPFLPGWAVPGATVLGFGVVVVGGLYGFFRVMERLPTGV